MKGYGADSNDAEWIPRLKILQIRNFKSRQQECLVQLEIQASMV